MELHTPPGRAAHPKLQRSKRLHSLSALLLWLLGLKVEVIQRVGRVRSIGALFFQGLLLFGFFEVVHFCNVFVGLFCWFVLEWLELLDFWEEVYCW